jgi:hypothetical protein
MVGRWAANAATDSVAGMDARVRPPSRVNTTLWATPGWVNSCPSAAAAPASEDTPGTISHARPADRHQSICSPMAP